MKLTLVIAASMVAIAVAAFALADIVGQALGALGRLPL